MKRLAGDAGTRDLAMFFVRAWAGMALRLNLARTLRPATARECEFLLGRSRGFRGEQRLYDCAKVVFNTFNAVLYRSGFVIVVALLAAST
jgi:hypothetical protein